MREGFKHLRRWETAEAWVARAATREIRASRADMVLLRCGGDGAVAARSVAMEIVVSLLGFADRGVQERVLNGDA